MNVIFLVKYFLLYIYRNQREKIKKINLLKCFIPLFYDFQCSIEVWNCVDIWKCMKINCTTNTPREFNCNNNRLYTRNILNYL
jgi:hypothetical protein